MKKEKNSKTFHLALRERHVFGARWEETRGNEGKEKCEDSGGTRNNLPSGEAIPKMVMNYMLKI